MRASTATTAPLSGSLSRAVTQAGESQSGFTQWRTEYQRQFAWTSDKYGSTPRTWAHNVAVDATEPPWIRSDADADDLEDVDDDAEPIPSSSAWIDHGMRTEGVQTQPRPNRVESSVQTRGIDTDLYDRGPLSIHDLEKDGDRIIYPIKHTVRVKESAVQTPGDENVEPERGRKTWRRSVEAQEALARSKTASIMVTPQDIDASMKQYDLVTRPPFANYGSGADTHKTFNILAPSKEVAPNVLQRAERSHDYDSALRTMQRPKSPSTIREQLHARRMLDKVSHKHAYDTTYTQSFAPSRSTSAHLRSAPKPIQPLEQIRYAEAIPPWHTRTGTVVTSGSKIPIRQKQVKETRVLPRSHIGLLSSTGTKRLPDNSVLSSSQDMLHPERRHYESAYDDHLYNVLQPNLDNDDAHFTVGKIMHPRPKTHQRNVLTSTGQW